MTCTYPNDYNVKEILTFLVFFSFFYVLYLYVFICFFLFIIFFLLFIIVFDVALMYTIAMLKNKPRRKAMKYNLKTTFTLLSVSILTFVGCGVAQQAIDNVKDDVKDQIIAIKKANKKPGIRYGGLGSFWSFNKYDDGTFDISRQENRSSVTDGTVSGTYQLQESGFTKLTITAGTGRFEEIAEEITAYGIEVPKSLFILKVPGENKLIYMPALDECPTQNFTSNAILTNEKTLVYNDGTITHGIVEINTENNTGQADGREFGDKSNIVNSDITEFKYRCNNGELEVGDTDNVQDGVLSPSGIGAVASSGGLLLVPQDVNVQIPDLQGNFAGVAWTSSNTEENRKIDALSIVFSDSGSGIAHTLDSVDGSGIIDDEFDIAVTEMSAGSVPGAFLYSIKGDTSNTDTALGTMLVVDDLGGSGKTFIAGLGQTKNNTDAYFMFAIQK